MLNIKLPCDPLIPPVSIYSEKWKHIYTNIHGSIIHNKSEELLFSCVWLFVTPWSLPVSSVHGISQARILEWVAISFSRPNDRTTQMSINWSKLINGKTKCSTIQRNIQVSKGKKYWYTLQHAGTTNTKLKKVSHQVSYIIIFHMWKSRTAKSIETESRFVVA